MGSNVGTVSRGGSLTTAPGETGRGVAAETAKGFPLVPGSRLVGEGVATLGKLKLGSVAAQAAITTSSLRDCSCL